MQQPIIKTFETSRRYKYLWLKYVNGFNLDAHCARCLLGEYSRAFGYSEQAKSLSYFALDEHPARYYYLCGVSYPYVYENNLHIAFEYSEGDLLEYDDGETRIAILNARRIPIIDLYRYNLHEKGRYPEFSTCRNWRFAYQMTFFNRHITMGEPSE